MRAALDAGVTVLQVTPFAEKPAEVIEKLKTWTA